MAYKKTVWKNRLVEKPKTFNLQQNADGSVTLVPKEGQIIEHGTPVNAGNLNNIEEGIATLESQMGEYTAHKNNKEIHRKITFGTSPPTGGVDGDIYFQYE